MLQANGNSMKKALNLSDNLRSRLRKDKSYLLLGYSCTCLYVQSEFVRQTARDSILSDARTIHIDVLIMDSLSLNCRVYPSMLFAHEDTATMMCKETEAQV